MNSNHVYIKSLKVVGDYIRWDGFAVPSNQEPEPIVFFNDKEDEEMKGWMPNNVRRAYGYVPILVVK